MKLTRSVSGIQILIIRYNEERTHYLHAVGPDLHVLPHAHACHAYHAASKSLIRACESSFGGRNSQALT
ncbi:hypothetical protein ACN38_g12639 [Penicillium nordicum]|uniref:Uncharacterized protein n=1 Tax=Penicillium nordicum TaxID=229535 RepID=A0A0N0RXC8_9EURO|nr:hypothetical protein ACN38_g12639 [Penicillium nordicum]